MVATLLAALVVGALVGPAARALTRALTPRHRSVRVASSVGLGAAGALIGAWVYAVATGRTGDGADRTAMAIGGLVAAGLVLGHALVAGEDDGDATQPDATRRR